MLHMCTLLWVYFWAAAVANAGTSFPSPDVLGICCDCVCSCNSARVSILWSFQPLRDVSSVAKCSISMQLASPQIAKPKVNIGNPVSQPQTAAGKPSKLPIKVAGTYIFA